ncbi:peptidylprolyl isomerase [Catalinimonas alkaloidigena]
MKKISFPVHRAWGMLLLAFAVAIGLVSPARAQQKTNVDKIVAKVDNYIVLRSDVEMTYVQMLSNGEKDNGNLKCEVLENLLVSKMMLAKAEIDSVMVEDAMVEDQMTRRMQYFINQIGSQEKLEELYGKTIDQLKGELRKQVREQMIVQKMQETITADVKVTPAEVRKFFNSIPRDSLPYFSTEVEVGQIVKYPEVSKEQKQKAKEKLQDLRKRIVNGEDFAELSKTYSEDPGSAKKGGDLGWWGRGAMVPEFEGAALQLKPGEMSPVIESPFGFHLIRLEERKGTQYRARHILIKPESSTLDLNDAKDYLDSLRSVILADSISFEKAAKEYSDDEMTKTSGGFFVDPSTNISRMPVESIDPVVFFVIDTMKVGNISPPLKFRTEDGKDALRILYYKARTAPHQANLKEDYQKIYNAALAEKKQRLLSDWFESTRSEVYISIDPMYDSCDLLNKETF